MRLWVSNINMTDIFRYFQIFLDIWRVFISDHYIFQIRIIEKVLFPFRKFHFFIPISGFPWKIYKQCLRRYSLFFLHKPCNTIFIYENLYDLILWTSADPPYCRASVSPWSSYISSSILTLSVSNSSWGSLSTPAVQYIGIILIV